MNKGSFSQEFLALGTQVYLKINNISFQEFKEIFESVKSFFAKQEKIFSRFDKKSELSFFNNNLGIFSECSPEFKEVCELNIFLNKKSGGYFDPRIIDFLEEAGYDKDFKKIDLTSDIEFKWKGISNFLEDELILKNNKVCFLSRMDFSGIAKSFIAKRAFQLIFLRGVRDFLLDAGGDMVTQGTNGGNGWLVDLEGFSSNTYFNINNKSIATSGITRKKWKRANKKFHHLINPKKPQELSFDLKTVTVIHEDIVLADFWAKVLFIRGVNRGLELAKKEKIQAFFLDKEDCLHKS